MMYDLVNERIKTDKGDMLAPPDLVWGYANWDFVREFASCLGKNILTMQINHVTLINRPIDDIFSSFRTASNYIFVRVGGRTPFAGICARRSNWSEMFLAG
jgi:hypothetical protein